jgi:hypothetical protein
MNQLRRELFPNPVIVELVYWDCSAGEKSQKDIRKWLSPPDSLKNHKIARESQHAGTETWWIHGAAYAEWKSSGGPSSLLWIHGKR